MTAAAVEIRAAPGQVLVRVRNVQVFIVPDKFGCYRLAPPAWATKIRDVAQLEDVVAVIFEVARRMREGLNPETGKEMP